MFESWMLWAVVVAGVLAMTVGWILLKTLLKLTMRVFMLGCGAIVLVGLFGLGVAAFLALGAG